MNLYYYHDRFAHAQLNAAGQDYTPAYLPAILKNLGFSATELTPEALSALKAGDALVMGADTLSVTSAAALATAIERGVTVLAFGTVAASVFPQAEPVVSGADPYTVAGYFRFSGSEEPLPVLGGFSALTGANTVLGCVTAKDGHEHPVYAKIAPRVWYWSFDLPATLLYAADGRPTRNGQNGFGLGRVPDSCVLEPDYDYDIAFGDSYLRSVEDVLSAAGFARLWALPVRDGRACDLVLYFGGDDDAFSAENDLRAAEAMHQRGLPYHINLMPADAKGHFVVNREDMQRLHALGCETAIHYNFTVFPFSEEGHRMQMALYERAFGEPSGGPVNHCVIQAGTAAERYRMQVACGARSDNNRIQNKTDPNDINAFNLTGFAFGHAFPRFVLADAVHGNRQLPFCEIYNSYYEPRIYEGKPEEYQKLERYLDDSFAYGRTSQLFTHPHYISGAADVDPQPALRALDHMKAYVAEKGWHVWYTAPDALGDWWHDRAACTVSAVSEGSFTLENPTTSPVAVVLPAGVQAVSVNGNEASVTVKTVAGRPLALLCLQPGQSQVHYAL